MELNQTVVLIWSNVCLFNADNRAMNLGELNGLWIIRIKYNLRLIQELSNSY